MPITAITNNWNGLTNVIVTDVDATNIFIDSTVKTKGIWDTGATACAITSTLAQSLKLVPIGIRRVTGVHGTKDVNEFFLLLTFESGLKVKVRASECDKLSGDDSIGLLIGMDVITLGDFSITNKDGKTTMSFRVPSLSNVDYVKELNDLEQARYRHVRPNDPCPCGSKIKYKNCHGKNSR